MYSSHPGVARPRHEALLPSRPLLTKVDVKEIDRQGPATPNQVVYGNDVSTSQVARDLDIST